jgi:hypothetical protein
MNECGRVRLVQRITPLRDRAVPADMLGGQPKAGLWSRRFRLLRECVSGAS